MALRGVADYIRSAKLFVSAAIAYFCSILRGGWTRGVLDFDGCFSSLTVEEGASDCRWPKVFALLEDGTSDCRWPKVFASETFDSH